jgi:hypothetical protein
MAGTSHSDQAVAFGAAPSCLVAACVASKGQGVVRDCPVRLRLKNRVHAPS